MASSSSSDNETTARQRNRYPIATLLVSLAGLTLIFVIAYPFLAGGGRRPAPPEVEQVIEEVSIRMARLPASERLRVAQEGFRSPNPLVRQATVEAILDWKVTEAYPLLEQAFTDNCSAVRRRVLESLWRADRERGIRLLLAALRDDDIDIRRTALNQARFTDDRRLVPALIPLLDDGNPNIRLMAAGALRKITKQPYFAKSTAPREEQQAVIRQWKAWWAREQSRWAEVVKQADVAPIHPTRTDPAPAFALRSIDGERLRSRDLRGKLVLLHFYGTWCAPCETEMPHLSRLRQTYSPQELVMIGVAVNETQGDRAVREWIGRFRIAYPQALATPQVVSAYWVQGVPITYLIAPTGHIRYRLEGERDFETLRRIVERLRREVSATGSTPTPAGER
ncbi:MAG: HEAT repeat domain-containing protein [Armatimonadota bacterium]|nr:HEAT repeat domain-containing protein [Armatimonadota bacterium]MDW8289891.1 HEAT repeat domain-containing protein [Armatimonadota bacterium]